MTATKHVSDDEIQERLISLTRDLILIPSIPSRPDDRQRAFELIKNHLESLENIELREYEDRGIPSLVAAPPGCAQPEVLLCGHVDVIEHPDVSVYRSHIEEDRIYGPGSGDMKGAVAILLEIFRGIHTRFPKASLGIAITSDEETGGQSGVGFLANSRDLRCDVAMIPDGGSIDEITVEEKGILHLKLTVEGKEAHAARPWFGENPIEILMEKLAALRELFDRLKEREDHWHPTCAVTRIWTDNQQTNRIPSQAAAVLDIRFPPPFTVDLLLQDIKEKLGSSVQEEIIISAEPTHLSPDEDYVKATEEVTKKKVKMICDDGGSDARYLVPYGIPVMMSRPVVGNLHAIDEWIDIPSMVLLYRVYEKYLTKRFK